MQLDEIKQRLTEFVIVMGAPMTGKTLNKSALMDYFNCSECYDIPGQEHALKNSKAKRILILTWDVNLRNPRLKFHPRMEGLRVTVNEAALLLGDKWIKPESNFKS